MAQISVEIIRLSGSLLRGNLHYNFTYRLRSLYTENVKKYLLFDGVDEGTPRDPSVLGPYPA